MSIRTVMLALETRLDTIDGLHASGVKPEAITPPTAVVGVPPVDDYRTAYARGKYDLRPTITVLTSTVLDRTGQLALADYVSLTGPKSIPAVLAADRTLAGLVEDTEVESFRPLRNEEIGQIRYYGGLFVLRIMIREAV